MEGEIKRLCFLCGLDCRNGGVVQEDARLLCFVCDVHTHSTSIDSINPYRADAGEVIQRGCFVSKVFEPRATPIIKPLPAQHVVKHSPAKASANIPRSKEPLIFNPKLYSPYCPICGERAGADQIGHTCPSKATIARDTYAQSHVSESQDITNIAVAEDFAASLNNDAKSPNCWGL